MYFSLKSNLESPQPSFLKRKDRLFYNSRDSERFTSSFDFETANTKLKSLRSFEDTYPHYINTFIDYFQIIISIRVYPFFV